MGSAADDVLTAVTAFLDHRYGDGIRLALLEGNDDGASLRQAAAADGWFDLAVPEKHGGVGLALNDLVPAFRLFGERLAVGPFVEQMVLPALLLSELNLDEATRLRIQALRSGTHLLAWADPGISLDWCAGTVSTRNGRLNGEIRLVRYAPHCSELLVVADSPAGAQLCLVAAAASGLSIESIESADPGVPLAIVRFVDVPASSAVMADGMDAMRVIALMRAWSRIMFAAELTGMARRALTLTLDHIVTREQFGAPIATFQAVRQIAATAAQRVILLENFSEAVAEDASTQSADLLSLSAMAFKAAAGELARGVGEDAIQLHGGIGFTYEYELQWYYKRILALRTWYGDEIELMAEIGRLRLAA
ncbi:acyl-CoA dehydrogenase family protein [Pseudofrankia asymbiotica]|uniref:Acyl-CoA dehydrogenase/oxidase C-terminal domain-containing protein n=1 Tax=Pseudofrankia asymbiotica TaxID=1834516 RepID=A0A1V2HZ69_9ACTN|nr:acyl-CoA dehydrogenase family protein [Pseudofrankia asymbiotica]ONH21951.1 hypothetical protein BL253_37240 [Pseudofrankia asymbiotica]